MDNLKKISFLFIVPTLNSYKKLPKLVNSLTNQSYQKWRCVFVDGNSENAHKKWIKSICKDDSRFIMINENDSYYAEIGVGNLDIKNIIKEAKNSGCRWYVVEQDECTTHSV